MIWKRWGTAPTHDGTYSSGFEEEYERAVARREQSKRPEIAIFLQDVPDDLIADPGDDLKKVIAFKERLVAEKKILFKRFSNLRELERMTRTCIEEYIRNIATEDAISESSDITTGRSRDEQESSEGKSNTAHSGLMSGYIFLGRLADKLRHDSSSEDVTSSDIARLRLLANSISRNGNHEMSMGAHDLNLVFSAHKAEVDLSHSEILSLARFGLQHMNSENVPFWRWYSLLMRMHQPVTDVAIWSTVVHTNDDEKLGAFRVLTALGREIRVDSNTITRTEIVDKWFSDESSAPVRAAALSFLALHGTLDDYAVAKREYDKNDQAPSRDAFECMVKLRVRTGVRHSPQHLVLNSQFSSLSPALLSSVLHGFVHLETNDLSLGLEHPNAEVRLASLRALHERGAVTHTTAERLWRDVDAAVRRTAIAVFSEMSRELTEDEAKSILLRSNVGTHAKPPILGSSESDTKGRKLFEHYLRENLRLLSEDELTERINRGLLYDEAYFVRAERYFARYGNQLRFAVDDRFHKYFDGVVQRLKDNHEGASVSELLGRLREMADFLRKDLTRRGLDVLCRAGKPEDLDRIRRNFRCDYVRKSIADVEYIRKRGDWTDVSLFADANAVMPSLELTSWWTSDYDRYPRAVADAVLNLSRGHSLAILFSQPFPASVLKEIILQCSNSRFSDVSYNDLLGLLDNEEAEVRKIASLKAICVYSAKRIRSILYQYVGRSGYRYYNVIHWLDLGASMSRKDALRVARAALEQWINRHSHR